ncbi:hypothetical protein [Actinomadura montaniterrae]|uniref:Uncharacterized protein n=1 Tax=Actinomadura montaniterrae TaxID=1803903 RepID=A0A6L3VRZ1_9ACTN|nr:hypothetical protein [Actinomadura montaniterrae]KAB2373312.1 hypothetical protein F9B16_28710 [Actinomadura montaniterrae]
MKRFVPFIAALALVCAAASGCSHPREKEHLKVADEKKLSDGLDAFFSEVVDVLDAGKPATAPTGGPAPCDQFDVMDFKDGESSPYNIASFSTIDGIPPDKAVPAIMRLKAFAERSGWKVSSFRPATGGRKITELAGHAANYRYGYGYGFRVEALHDANRIVMSVGSDCVRDPRDHRR